MTKTSISLQELRRKIYIKAKSEKTWRFWGMYVHVMKPETLETAYKLAKANNGAPGIDGVTFTAIESQGREAFLAEIRDELLTQTYYPISYRQQAIPKEGGKSRILQIPAIRDRVVQNAVKLILEPIFENDFQDGSYGYRPKRTAHTAVERVSKAIITSKTKIIDVDLKSYFDTVRHDILLSKIASRINDKEIMRLIKLILKAGGTRGVAQGGPLSPLLSNIYLNEVDKMLEEEKEKTRTGSYYHVEYARWADDLVILVDGHQRYARLTEDVYKRLCEELTKLAVTINQDKTRQVDLAQGETFTFLGFEFRMKISRQGKRWPLKTPKMSARTRILRNLKSVFRKHRSQPISKVIDQINPKLRGWVNYYRIGNSSRSFCYVKHWVEEKVGRHIMHAKKRRGIGWKRWSKECLYQKLGLYSDYKIRYYHTQKVCPS